MARSLRGYIHMFSSTTPAEWACEYEIANLFLKGSQKTVRHAANISSTCHMKHLWNKILRNKYSSSMPFNCKFINHKQLEVMFRWHHTICSTRMAYYCKRVGSYCLQNYHTSVSWKKLCHYYHPIILTPWSGFIACSAWNDMQIM